MRGVHRLFIRPNGMLKSAAGWGGGLKKLDGFPSKSNDCDQIVLVDADDVPRGVAPKIEVHRRGLKHRALSVLVRNSSPNMLVHRRNAAKYHSGGLWTHRRCQPPGPARPPALR